MDKLAMSVWLLLALNRRQGWWGPEARVEWRERAVRSRFQRGGAHPGNVRTTAAFQTDMLVNISPADQRVPTMVGPAFRPRELSVQCPENLGPISHPNPNLRKWAHKGPQ